MADTLSNTSSTPSQNGIYITVATLGATAIFANIFILAVLFSNKKLLKHSAVMVGITISHLLCGSAIGSTGFFRLINYDRLNLPVDAGSA
jgi:hypothetical protein